jgi:hypothetical protein
MIEIVGRVVSHTQLLHHSARPDVGRNREGHQFFQPEHCEGVLDYLARALCGQSLPPVVR